MDKDKAFSDFIRTKHRLVDLGINYFRHNYPEDYMVFSVAWDVQQEKIQKLLNTIKLLESPNPVASQLFGKACARQSLKDIK